LLNTEGGNVVIGVDDERRVLGLGADYKLFDKKDKRDIFENFLTTLLLNNLGKDTSKLFEIVIAEIENKDVCRIIVKKSPKPIFVKDGEIFWIRAGNSKRQLSAKEAIDYFTCTGKNRGQPLISCPWFCH
jgi:predicted HTH transcriptional regulator